MDLYAVAAEPAEIQIRLLARALHAVRGFSPQPKLAAIEALSAALFQPEGAGAGSVHGVVFHRKGEQIFAFREARAPLPARLALQPGEDGVFDGRIAVSLAENGREAIEIGCLGPENARNWLAFAPEAQPGRASQIPAPARPGLPAVYPSGAVCAGVLPMVAARFDVKFTYRGINKGNTTAGIALSRGDTGFDDRA